MHACSDRFKLSNLRSIRWMTCARGRVTDLCEFNYLLTQRRQRIRCGN